MNNLTVPVVVAAKLLHVSEQVLRNNMQRGKIDIGVALPSEGRNRYTHKPNRHKYIIPAHKLKNFMEMPEDAFVKAVMAAGGFEE